MSGSSPTSTHSFRDLLSGPEGRKVVRAALPLVALHAGLLVVFDLSRRPGWSLLLLTAAFAAYLGAAIRLEKLARPAHILLVAGALRVVVLPLPPALSDDILRYVWDGRVVAAGFNPYGLAPEAEELAGLRDELWQRMPHRDVPSVYPPIAMGVFALAAWTPWPVTNLKILLSLADLVGCLLLIRLARSLKLPAGRALWYAWNPLVVMEIAGMGHVDALGVAAMVGAVFLLLSRRPAAAGAAAAAGVLAKLVPIVAVPLWTRWAGRAGRPSGALRFLAVSGLVVVIAGLPVFMALGGAPPPGLVRYGITWEFNGPLYEPLWRTFRDLDLATTVKSGLDSLKLWSGHHDSWNRLYPYVYPQFLAKLVLMTVLLGIILVSLFPSRSTSGSTSGARESDGLVGARSLVAATGRLVGGALLCSATLYPWYTLWVLPWAALRRQPAWLGLSALMLLAYVPQLFGLDLYPWIYLLIWGPFFLLLSRSRWSFA